VKTKVKLPPFLKGAKKTAGAVAAGKIGTKFLNRKIPDDFSQDDLRGLLVIALEEKRPRWYVERVHGILSRRRMYGERTQLGI
jgi:hypothetical protein